MVWSHLWTTSHCVDDVTCVHDVTCVDDVTRVDDVTFCRLHHMYWWCHLCRWRHLCGWRHTGGWRHMCGRLSGRRTSPNVWYILLTGESEVYASLMEMIRLTIHKLWHWLCHDYRPTYLPTYRCNQVCTGVHRCVQVCTCGYRCTRTVGNDGRYLLINILYRSLYRYVFIVRMLCTVLYCSAQELTIV